MLIESQKTEVKVEVLGTSDPLRENITHTYIEAIALVRVLPSQVEAPANLVRIIFQTAVGGGVAQEENSSERDLTRHHVPLDTDSQSPFHLFLL